MNTTNTRRGFTQNINKDFHSRGMLSGIFRVRSRSVNKENSLFVNNPYAVDPRQKPSGMTPNLMGFTLIELLVVVLIIGILAAVAVSQYQKAVLKSKFMTTVQIAEQLAVALEVYREQNGSYPDDNIRALDISFSGCDIIGGGGMFCKDTWYDYGGGTEYYESQGAHILVAYKSDKQHTIAAGLTEKVFYYKRYLDHSRVNPGKRACYPLSTKGTKLCTSLPGASKQTSGQDANWYFFNL